MFKSTADGMVGCHGMLVARHVDMAYNAGGGLVTTLHHRQVVNIASGTARSIRHAPISTATVPDFYYSNWFKWFIYILRSV